MSKLAFTLMKSTMQCHTTAYFDVFSFIHLISKAELIKKIISSLVKKNMRACKLEKSKLPEKGMFSTLESLKSIEIIKSVERLYFYHVP